MRVVTDTEKKHTRNFLDNEHQNFNLRNWKFADVR